MLEMLDDDGRYAVVRGHDTLTLSDRVADVGATILPAAGNVVAQLTMRGTPILRWPYDSLTDFQARPAWNGIPLLAPWANRLDEQAFHANGVRYPLNPDSIDPRWPLPIHGFLGFAAGWRVTAEGADASGCWVTSRLEVWRRPEWMAQFPFAHDLVMTHRLADGRLSIETTIQNHSDSPLPVAIGFHPYFHLGDAPRDTWVLSLPAQRRWVLSPALLPTGETVPTDAVYADRHAIRLDGLALDDVFTDLDRDEAGLATIVAQGQGRAIEVTLGPRFRALVVYAPEPRANDAPFICIEPMAAITNAFNLAHRGLYHDLQSVPAGGTWQETFSVKPSGF